jgi:hypothetical protein
MTPGPAEVDRSPIVDLLAALDKLDLDAAMSLCTSDCHVMTADGRHAQGQDAVRELLGTFLSQLRSMNHEILSLWHVKDAWIAELVADYELNDWSKIERLPRAIVLRVGADGISDVRIYGAHEQQLSEHRGGDQAVRIGGRLLLPL